MENIWDKLSIIKDEVVKYANMAKANNWIADNEYGSILERIENDALTIAVIGQMKSGKSTFLNAFLFKDNVLPAASTPMTAALSIITYGEKEEVIAEFYSAEEWEEVEQKALLDENEIDIKAAKEIKEKASGLGEQINTLLGKSKSASLSELQNYVGADGKYTPITKSVMIKIPDIRLKGVRIVDTPGFNDPVISREEKTKTFLKEADVVILLMYAGRAFDESDRDILFEKVKNVGVGKIIIGINKYDIELANGESIDDIKKHIRNTIKKAVQEKNDPVLNYLLTNPEPILLSANMALLGTMPPEKIKADKDLQWHYGEISEKFRISSQEAFLSKSNIYDLENEINTILSGEKIDILVRRPINKIQACIDTKRTELEKITLQLIEKRKDLRASDTDLEEKRRMFSRAKRKTDRVIESKEDDIKEFLNEKIRDTIFRLKKIRLDKIQHFHTIIDTQKKAEKIKKEIEKEFQNVSWTIEGEYKDLYIEVKSKFKKVNNETIDDLEEILSDLSDDDDWMEQKEKLVSNCRKELEKFSKLSFEDMFTSKNIEKGKNKVTFLGVLSDVGITALTGLIGLGIKKIIQSVVEQKKFLEDAHKQVDLLLPMDKIEETFDPIHEQSEEFLSFFKRTFIDDLLNPIMDNINQMESNDFNREKELEKIEKELLIINERKTLIEEQLAVVGKFINNLTFVDDLFFDEIHLGYNPKERITKLSSNGRIIELTCIKNGKGIAIESYIPDFFNALQKELRLGKGAKRKLSFYGTKEDFNTLLQSYQEYTSQDYQNKPEFKLKFNLKEFNQEN